MLPLRGRKDAEQVAGAGMIEDGILGRLSLGILKLSFGLSFLD